MYYRYVSLLLQYTIKFCVKIFDTKLFEDKRPCNVLKTRIVCIEVIEHIHLLIREN